MDYVIGEEPESFIMGSKHACSLLCLETPSLLPMLVSVQAFLKR